MVLTPKRDDASKIERVFYVQYMLYSAFCFCKISRLFALSINIMPQIKCISNACFNMIPFFLNLVSMLGIVLLIYAQIGIHLFGGEINSNTPTKYETITGGVVMTDSYARLNFNSFPTALMFLWSFIINNNWIPLSIQCMANDGNPLVWVYFISFNIITNTFILNIVIGFIIDVLVGYLKNVKSHDVSFKDMIDGAINDVGEVGDLDFENERMFDEIVSEKKIK